MAIFNYSYNDFTGFTFNGKHSSEFKVLRTNDGSDRYQDSLIPAISDISEEVPGGIGEYYFGSSYGARDFSINIAYDELSEKDKRLLKQWLYPDHSLHELIFDEKPFVRYWVKLSSAPEFSELCFDNKQTGQRVYKGEASLRFTAYMPFGIVVDKFLDSDIYDKYNNIDQWGEAGGLLSKREYTSLRLDKFDKAATKYSARLYNPGDVNINWTLDFVHSPITTVFSLTQTLINQFSNLPHINQNGISLESSYIIFADKKLTVSYSEGAWRSTNAETNEKKTYSVNGNYFIDTDGNSYQSYSMVSNDTVGMYSCDSLDDIEVGTLIHLMNGNDISTYYVIQRVNDSIYLYQTDYISESVYGETLKGTNVAAESYEISLLKNKEVIDSFTITFPQVSYTSSDDIGLLETASARESEFKIDTQKQTICFKYKTDEQNYTPWTGVSGLITKGNIFTIPTQVSLSETVYTMEITALANQANTISDPEISYTYLYR